MSNPPLFSRDDNGLIKGFNYFYDPLGRVDWKKHLLPNHLYVSPDYQVEVMTRQNVKSKWDIDTTKCEDRELLVTLAGLKYLANLRGVVAEPPPILHVTPTEVICSCSIQFEPNYENPDGLIMSGTATASVYNVSGKFQLYLSSMAHNRALTRAIKDALRIEILGFEEVDFKASKAFEDSLKAGDNPLLASAKAPVQAQSDEHKVAGFDGNAFLARRCGELNKNGSHSFEKIREHAISIKDELTSDPSTWTSFESIPRLDSMTLIEKINKAAEGKKTKAK